MPNGDAIVRTHNAAVGQRVGSQGCAATDDFDGIVQKGSAIHLTTRPAHPCTFQRPMYWRPSTIGRCSLIPTEQRASLSDRVAQRVRMLQEVNNLRVLQPDGLVKNPNPEVYVKRSPLVQRLKLSAVMRCYGIASTFGILT